MPGSNTLGTPQTKFYNLGRGRLYAALLDSDGNLAEGYRDLGNAPAFSSSMEVEELEHRSSRSGTSNIDKTVTISQDLSIAFDLDEITDENLALWLAGAASAYTNAAVAGFTKYSMISSVELGKSYEIQDSNGNRAYGIDTADLTLEVGATPLVENTDYTLDTVNGLIFFLTTASNVADTDTVDVTLAAEATATDVTQVKGLTGTNREYAVKFIAVNPVSNDEEAEYTFLKVRLQADGDQALIGDEWATMSYTGQCSSNTALDSSGTPVIIRKATTQS